MQDDILREVTIDEKNIELFLKLEKIIEGIYSREKTIKKIPEWPVELEVLIKLCISLLTTFTPILFKLLTLIINFSSVSLISLNYKLLHTGHLNGII